MADANEILNGKDLFGDVIKDVPKGPVAERFLIPPFSVLNAREGDWRERKRKWLAIGIQSEVGRIGNALDMSATMAGITDPEERRVWNDNRNKSAGEKMQAVGRKADLLGNRMGFTLMERNSGSGVKRQTDGTSIFDPVLCELVYRWFCAPGGQVVDPFAGGSVRGILASLLGLKYWGCDLRPEQIEANNQQASVITPSSLPTWVCGCALAMIPNAPQADLIFSCPPYGNLEVYSDHQLDLSNMEWDNFRDSYYEIIKRSCERLNLDRFACFVVGDYRDKKTGHYKDFVSMTIDAFREAGASLYNEAILVTSVGSLSIRITKQFESGRKMGKTHQNVLVFCKGDWCKAAEFATGRKVENE